MREICYAAEINKEMRIILSIEHENYKWCTKNEAKKLLKWDYNLIALEKLIRLLKLEWKNKIRNKQF